jgi:Zn-finger nucleic acid-binding protein
LATVRCASCFSLELAGSKHCAQCGEMLGLEGIEGDLGIRCPRCRDVDLVGLQVGDVRVGECLRCTGLFLDHRTLERVTRRADARAGLRLRPLALGPTTPETSAYLPCPRCGTHMNRRNFGERSGIVVDVCGEHGVWFDRDELARAVEFVDAGGLDRLRERDRVATTLQRRLASGRRVDPAALDSYDMVGTFLSSLLRSGR